MKKITFLKSLLMALAILLSNGLSWGQYSGTGTFEEITTLEEIDSETYYVFYGINTTYNGAMKNTIVSGRLGNSAVTFTGNNIVNPDLSIVWKISGNSTSGYTIFNEQVSKFCQITTNTTSGFSLTDVSNHTYEATLNGAKGFFFKSNSSSGGSRGLSIYQTDWRPYAASGAYTLKVYKLTVSGGTPSVATPTFDPAAGTYTSAQNVTISTTTADASIYYTTNGDEPTEASTLYTTPVAISTTTTLKAKAYKAGMDPSTTATAAYTINPTPTITVTEVGVPAMSSVVPNIDTEIINITGTNLTGEITLTIDAIDGFDATVFGVSTPTLPSTGGVATISFAPGAPGVYAATLKINSAGAAEVTRTLNGTATLKTPEATDATGLSPTGFTANWEIVEGATSYELSVYTKNSGGTTATDLFMSEYGEGSGGNKKYIEIYNGTGSSVDLSNYTIKKSTNGGGWATTYNFPATTTIANNSTFVIANNSTDVIGATVFDTFANWNGDDAVGLFKNDVLIDIFGTPDSDPGTGWAIAGVENASVDHILIRKPTVTTPTTDWAVSSGTTEENSQWIVSSFVYNATDQTTNLGSHTMSGAGSSLLPIDGSPFTIISGTEKGITGLLSDTHYFYTVIAKYGSYSSLVSNEIEVVTSRHTGIEQSEILNNIYVLNDKVMFNSAAGEIVEIYNSVGQRVVNTISVDGVNSIKLEAKGVMLVKIGNRVGKVIM